MGKVISVASGKGGVGKSVITANLGMGLSKFGRKTLMIDGDLPASDLSMFLGIKDTPITFYDVLVGNRSLEEVIYQVYGGADFVPAGASLDDFLRINLDKFKEIIDQIKNDYRYILIDTPPGINKYSLGAIRAADEILWVISPDRPSINDTLRLKSRVENFGMKALGIIVNRAPNFSFWEKRKIPTIKKSEIERQLGARVIASIPEDKDVYKSIRVEKPLLKYSPKGDAGKAFKSCAKRVILLSEKKKSQRDKSKL